MLHCINGVSSNPVEGRTNILQLNNLILTLFGLIFRRIYIYIYILIDLILLCLTPLSAIFQLYHGEYIYRYIYIYIYVCVCVFTCVCDTFLYVSLTCS